MRGRLIRTPHRTGEKTISIVLSPPNSLDLSSLCQLLAFPQNKEKGYFSDGRLPSPLTPAGQPRLLYPLWRRCIRSRRRSTSRSMIIPLLLACKVLPGIVFAGLAFACLFLPDPQTEAAGYEHDTCQHLGTSTQPYFSKTPRTNTTEPLQSKAHPSQYQ